MPKLIIYADGVKAQCRLISNNEEKEEGEINDDDEDEKDTQDKDKSTSEAKTKNYDDSSARLSLPEMQKFLIALILPEPRLSSPPTWCKVLKCMRAENVAIFLLDNNDIDWIEDLGTAFNYSFKFQTSPDWIQQLLDVPMSRRLQNMHNQQLERNETEENFNAPIRVPKTELLLSPIQMIYERYPLPNEISIECLLSHYEKVTNDSPVFALDCEMCLTVGNVSELTRISIVDEEMRVVYNQLVKPASEITNYLTKYSGITPAMMDNVKTTIEDVHEFIRKKLPYDAILCGHSLNNDLKALKMFHPYIIDTSVIYNNSGNRTYKPSLKSLAYEFLKKDIQTSSKFGHNSLEDAITAMELCKLKMVNGRLFGDVVAREQSDGLRYDPRTGNPFLPFDQFIERQKVVELAFRRLDITPGARCVYVHDLQTPLSDEVRDVITKLLNSKTSVCVLLTSNGQCLVKV